MSKKTKTTATSTTLAQKPEPVQLDAETVAEVCEVRDWLVDALARAERVLRTSAMHSSPKSVSTEGGGFGAVRVEWPLVETTLRIRPDWSQITRGGWPMEVVAGVNWSATGCQPVVQSLAFAGILAEQTQKLAVQEAEVQRVVDTANRTLARLATSWERRQPGRQAFAWYAEAFRLFDPA